MPSVWFEKCCFCIPLRIGAFILGYMIMSLNIVEFLITEINVTAMKMLIKAHDIKDSKMTLMMYMKYAVAFVYAMQTVMSITLLVGLHKRKREHVKKFYKVYPVLMALFYIMLLISMAVNGSTYTGVQWLMHLVDLAVLLFKSYTLFVVVRCSKEMKTQEIEREGVIISVADPNDKQSNV